MTRQFLKLIGKLGPPLVVVLLAGLLLTGLTVVHSAQPALGSRAELAIAAGSEQCYTWEAVNGTDQDADGLHIELTGVQTVTQLYTGDANPFGEAGAASGYDPGNNRYTVVLGGNGVVVASGEAVRIGVCTPQVVSATRFAWEAGTTVLAPDATAPALAWGWPAGDTLDLQFSNTTGVTITLFALQLLDPGTALDLDSLDGAIAAQIPSAGEGITETLELAPGSVVSSTFTFAVDPEVTDVAILFAAQWAEGEDLAVTSALYAQTTAPALPHVYLPAVNR